MWNTQANILLEIYLFMSFYIHTDRQWNWTHAGVERSFQAQRRPKNYHSAVITVLDIVVVFPFYEKTKVFIRNVY